MRETPAKAAQAARGDALLAGAALDDDDGGGRGEGRRFVARSAASRLITEEDVAALPFGYFFLGSLVAPLWTPPDAAGSSRRA